MKTINKKIIGTICSITLVITGLYLCCGCTDLKEYYANNFEVSSNGSVFYINHSGEPLKLWINGEHNQVFINRNVAIQQVTLSSNTSICFVSTFHGNQTVLNTLISGRWTYYD